MSLVEAFVWVFMFVGIYGGMVAVSFVADRVLRKLGKKGIWPEGYFKW